mgnify:CR=1 FL=1
MVIQKPEVANKSVLTLEFYDIKDNPYPIFCNKCKILLDPVPLKEICKVVSDSCPKHVEKISSPSRKLLSTLEESIGMILNYIQSFYMRYILTILYAFRCKQ